MPNVVSAASESEPSAEPTKPSKPIHESAGAGDLDAVNYHLANGKDVNARDATGKTPLIWAVRGNKPEVIYHLLDKGADPNIADNKGITPLLWAVRSRRAEIVSVLIGKGADLNVKDPKGMSALDLAEKFRADTVAELLRSATAPSNPAP